MAEQTRPARGMRDFLPDEIIAKTKHGFGLPFGVWMVRNAELRRLAMRSLDMLHDSQIVRPEFLRRLDNELMPSAPGYYGELVWILMMLGQWIGQSPVAHSNDPVGLPKPQRLSRTSRTGLFPQAKWRKITGER